MITHAASVLSRGRNWLLACPNEVVAEACEVVVRHRLLWGKGGPQSLGEVFDRLLLHEKAEPGEVIDHDLEGETIRGRNVLSAQLSCRESLKDFVIAKR